ncbi:SDR family NAD(P)-dependent oxidoreductase, partial [Burkholderia contaminans]|nr:SDR family NAD(P)-dependent oxidoreductase [Burkholderia contaminans]
MVLVTGANRGIGFEIVKALVESPLPYHVFLGSRDITKGKAAAAKLHPGSGSSISVLPLDVSSSDNLGNAP